jgi:uridylate kinase
VLQERLQVMEATAISLCMDNKLPIPRLQPQDAGQHRRVVMGEALGTLVSRLVRGMSHGR